MGDFGWEDSSEGLLLLTKAGVVFDESIEIEDLASFLSLKVFVLGEVFVFNLYN